MEDDMNKNGLVQVRLSTWINYLKLKEKVRRLEAGGVGNWEGYDIAMAPRGKNVMRIFVMK
jgi:hypothetical protein